MTPPESIFSGFVFIIMLFALACTKLLWNHLKLPKDNTKVYRAWTMCRNIRPHTRQILLVARNSLIFFLFCFSVCFNPNGNCCNNFQSKPKPRFMCSCQGENKHFLCRPRLLEWMDTRLFLWYGTPNKLCFFYMVYKTCLGAGAALGMCWCPALQVGCWLSSTFSLLQHSHSCSFASPVHLAGEPQY